MVDLSRRQLVAFSLAAGTLPWFAGRAVAADDFWTAPTPGPVRLIAHRGFPSPAPENTVEAMTLALSRGAYAIETDVQTTADGSLKLFHDREITRLTGGRGKFTELTDIQVDALRFVKIDDPAYRDTRISNFHDYLALAHDRKVAIMPEIKFYRKKEDVPLFVDAISAFDLTERCCLYSMRWEDLVIVRKRHPTISLGYAHAKAGNYATWVDHLAELGRGALLIEMKQLLAAPELVAYCKSKGVDLACWTIKSQAEAERIKAAGCSALLADLAVS